MIDKPVIAVLPGDGIGPEVTEQACRVLSSAARLYDFEIQLKYGALGGAAIQSTGSPLPKETRLLTERSHAVLAGAVGGPAWDHLPPEQNPGLGGMLKLRQSMELFANLRPAVSLPGAPTKIDIMLVREATGGAYFAQPRGRSHTTNGPRAFDTIAYSENEIRRILRVAIEIARSREARLISVDKANVLESSRLWREIAEDEIANSGIEATHLYVDNVAYQLGRNPSQFDVLVTENMFGDILSDQLAGIVGSLGLLPSAGVGRGSQGLYEPVHGSAPEITDKGIANPLAAIRSVALLLRHSLQAPAAGSAVEAACDAVLAAGYRTADIAFQHLREANRAPVSTQRFGDLVLSALESGTALR